MPFKMLFTDIDGTLLNSDHRITSRTKASIGKLVAKGVPVVLVSARMPKGILPLQRELELSGPMICYSGAYVLEHTRFEPSPVIADQRLDSTFMRNIYETALQHGVTVTIYREDTWYVEDAEDKWVKQEAAITGAAFDTVRFSEMIEQWTAAGSGPHKVLCMGEADRIGRLEQALKQMYPNLAVYRSKSTYLEIMAEGVSKTSAIRGILEQVGVDGTEIVAAGDNFNDIDMIHYAGLGVVMGNAPDEVKRHADVITESNDEDGLARIIERYFLA